MIEHKHGGVVTPKAIGHNTDSHQVPYWYVRGDVKWSDGSESKDLEIPPYALCHGDDGSADLDALLEKLSDYLATRGKHLRTAKKLRSGHIVHWMPTEACGVLELAQGKTPA